MELLPSLIPSPSRSLRDILSPGRCPSAIAVALAGLPFSASCFSGRRGFAARLRLPSASVLPLSLLSAYLPFKLLPDITFVLAASARPHLLWVTVVTWSSSQSWTLLTAGEPSLQCPQTSSRLALPSVPVRHDSRVDLPGTWPRKSGSLTPCGLWGCLLLPASGGRFRSGSEGSPCRGRTASSPSLTLAQRPGPSAWSTFSSSS